MDKADQLKNYIIETLNGHHFTINDLEVSKVFTFHIKPSKIAKSLGLVICENIKEAAEVVSTVSVIKKEIPDYYFFMFNAEANNLGIEPNEPVGIDIDVSPAYSNYNPQYPLSHSSKSS